MTTKGREAETSHILLTRFNLPSPGYERLLREKPDWLPGRADLFERFCFPSVRAQTAQDFEWLVYFDPNSPTWLLSRISLWQDYPRFHPIFRDQVLAYDVCTDLKAILPALPHRIITTNLDNDDGLACSFTARVRALDPGIGRTAIFLETGLVLAGDRLFLNRDRDNAFCSVAENMSNMVTCWTSAHNKLHLHMRTINAGEPPGWLQVVHGANVSNRVRGRRVSPRPYATEFGREVGRVPTPGPGAFFADRFLRHPARLLREILRRAAKGMVRSISNDGGPDRIKAAWEKGRRLL